MLSYYLILSLFSICMFVLVTLWLQSGLDKVTDFKGNLDWLNGQFSKTPFKKIVKSLLVILTMLEVSTGIIALVSIFELWINRTVTFAFVTCCLSMTTLSALFFGQRISKEYAGAAGIINYMVYILLLCAFTFAVHLVILPHPYKLF